MGFGRPAGKKTPFFPPPPEEGSAIPVYRAPNGQLQGGSSVFSSPPGRGAQYGNGHYPPPDQVGGRNRRISGKMALSLVKWFLPTSWENSKFSRKPGNSNILAI